MSTSPSQFRLGMLTPSSNTVLEPLTAAFVWSVLAVVMAVFSGRLGWVTLSLQCTALLLAARNGAYALTIGRLLPVKRAVLLSKWTIRGSLLVLAVLVAALAVVPGWLVARRQAA